MASSPSVTVFAAGVHLTVTVEEALAGGDEIHFHAGGQGVWVARTVLRLGEVPVLCTSTGGEPGSVFETLLAGEEIGLSRVRVAQPTATYVHDRRSGERTTVATSPPSSLDRHELDDLYESVLQCASDTGVFVLTGSPRTTRVPPSFFTRLGADLASIDARVVADSHGPELDHFLTHGRLEVLKVSDEDLDLDGVDVVSPAQAFAVMERFRDRGVVNVVVTRGPRSALALMEGRRLEAVSPEVVASDHLGSGDAMTGAFAVAVARGLDAEDLLALGCGAGAASATRRGLATASAPLISELAHRVTVAPC